MLKTEVNVNKRVHRFAYLSWDGSQEFWDSDWGEDESYFGYIVKNINSEQERLKSLEKRVSPRYPQSVYFSDRKNRYVRLYRKQSLAKFIKHKNNKRVRRYKGEILNGNHYRKISEFWWEYC